MAGSRGLLSVYVGVIFSLLVRCGVRQGLRNEYLNIGRLFLRVTGTPCADILRFNGLQPPALGRKPLADKMDLGNVMFDSLSHGGHSTKWAYPNRSGCC